jgi:hypothetical protein
LSIDIAGLKRVLARECGKGTDIEFQSLLETLWNYYGEMLVSPSLALLYLHVKYHALNIILAEVANLYDTKEIDIEEKEGQKFDHWWKLYAQTEKSLATEIATDPGTFAISISVMTKNAPLPYTLLTYPTYLNPNDTSLSGLPLPYYVRPE